MAADCDYGRNARDCRIPRIIEERKHNIGNEAVRHKRERRGGILLFVVNSRDTCKRGGRDIRSGNNRSRYPDLVLRGNRRVRRICKRIGVDLHGNARRKNQELDRLCRVSYYSISYFAYNTVKIKTVAQYIPLLIVVAVTLTA